ncbi:hypothetical protein TRFO_37275 [Tritrichomonas foetus]|uniref:Uncharacterized protein n=1 Tax=Tritrichomonas foetus TaxID=1144522 RepID=A0A1J4JBK8_9EUKA|nr:hypothetical protein TRFO_37275 [Tritrichomonas foetus]|eukprot:OHS96566.1 hypothetical protein TRFO_37275 [Tritrichomonas foetus]
MNILFFLLSFSFSKTRYGIMIDAGSSGTRAHIYTWKSTKDIPNVQPAPANGSKPWLIKIKIPLASAAKNMSLIDTIFKQVIIYASERIPAAYLEKTRIYVYATAGMRLLSDIDQEIVINKTFDYLTAHSPFKVKRKNVRVIDGIEEGIFGWLSVNHLLGNFINKKPTVGALDMGGASFQIALEVGAKEKPLQVVSVGSKRIPMYSYSYLGYGANEALKSLTRSLYAITPSTVQTFEHPCYPKGYKNTYKDRNFIGTGDFEKCSTLTEQIMLQATSFSSINVPSLSTTNEFVAMASFYYANTFLKLSETSSLAELKDASTKFCATEWNEIIKTNEDNEFTSTYCWYSIYQWNVLSKGYHFEDGKTKVAKLDEINGAELSWTIGAMLSHVAEIEIDEEPNIAYPVLIAANIFAFLILLPIYAISERRRKAPRRYSMK